MLLIELVKIDERTNFDSWKFFCAFASHILLRIEIMNVAR